MTLTDWSQIGILFLILLLITKPLGLYLYTVFESKASPRILFSLEKRFYALCLINTEEQDWKAYTTSLLIFNGIGIFIVFMIESLQPLLPLNPQNLPSVSWDLALNTAISFVTNTNWQAYSGETTMSTFTQMTALTWQNFLSASTGMAAFFAFARGITRQRLEGSVLTLGNFWVDLVKSLFYVFLPASILFSLILVSQGVMQNFEPALQIKTLEGGAQILPMGPVASQEAIKLLGTNGGGIFNSNSSHPFENPTPLSNFLQIICFISIPAALTYTYGRMTRDQKQGWSIFSVMIILGFLGAAVTSYFESEPNLLLDSLPLSQEQGNLEGKEVRFGSFGSALYATFTTATACGATNCSHDSFTPLGGLVLLSNILLGEVIFGGVGMGLFGMLIYVIITVFLAGLMVGRTPEYLGKKIEGKEVRLATLIITLYPLLILLGSSLSLITTSGLSSIHNPGPHGLSEVLYAFSSTTQNNGSAFSGLNGNTVWYNLMLSLTMLLGRFLPICLGLAIAGSLVNKKIVVVSTGTFETKGFLFIGLLLGVILIVGALTYFPVLTLGPIAEQLISRIWQGL
jgi:K+-transporting ATPase ATPase A chain